MTAVGRALLRADTRRPLPPNAMGKLQKFRLLADVQGGRLEPLAD